LSYCWSYIVDKKQVWKITKGRDFYLARCIYLQSFFSFLCFYFQFKHIHVTHLKKISARALTTSAGDSGFNSKLLRHYKNGTRSFLTKCQSYKDRCGFSLLTNLIKKMRWFPSRMSCREWININQQHGTYSRRIFFLTSTSFSTEASSNSWSRKLFRRRTVSHSGHVPEPLMNNRSTQLSHL